MLNQSVLEFLLLAIFGLVVGYLFGAFPTGYFAGKLYGVDVRKHGSGRTGGTNVLRSVGLPAFIITVAGDIIKGIIPVLLMRAFFGVGEIAPAFATLGTVIGHNWSIFIAFMARQPTTPQPPPRNALDSFNQFLARAKGGAGVATGAAAALVLYYPPALLLAPIGIVVILVTRYSSIASITVAALYPFFLAYFVFTGAAPWVYLPIGIIGSAIIVYALVPNMKRLRAGTEQKFGERLGKPRKSSPRAEDPKPS